MQAILSPCGSGDTGVDPYLPKEAGFLMRQLVFGFGEDSLGCQVRIVPDRRLARNATPGSDRPDRIVDGGPPRAKPFPTHFVRRA